MNEKPNIILILTDDLGYGDVSCNNPESKIHTENIDRLASQGMRMTDAHASSAVCTPSRYALLTGRYNWRSRLKRTVLPGQSPALIENGRETLATLLKSKGYKTACVGKWHLGMDWETTPGYKLPMVYEEVEWDKVATGIDYSKPIKNGPNEKGFDYYYGMPASLDQPPFVHIENDRVITLPDHTEGVIEFRHCEPHMSTALEFGPAEPGFDPQKIVPEFDQKVIDLIDDYSKDEEPFFIYVPTPAVHGPLCPAEEFVGKSGIGPYGDFVLQLDNFVGRVMDKLDECGISDNTILIFTSDNGCSTIVDIPKLQSMGHFPSYIYRGAKGDIFDGGHRIPFVVRWPKHIPAGKTCAQTGCLVDMFATFADITGAKYEDNAGEDSVSQWKLWKGEDEPIREATIHHSLFGSFAIRKGKWKMEFCPGSGSNNPPFDHECTGPKYQLYDMENDIRETTNLYGKYPEVEKELTELAAHYILDGRSTPGEPQKNYPSENWPGIEWLEERI
ncbi:MAG: arylsulfatase [Eubacterium sp.]|nr:arylsulfatase [Eubacterium sp.]